MWGAFLKIFKTSTFRSESCEENIKPNESEMSYTSHQETINNSDDVPQIRSLEEYEESKAKQRASILWLIAKANNNKVPDDLKEPFYKDYENQDQLKPIIVHSLANAELYCLALSVIYADPNYHRLNHWGVIQALARKGVFIMEPTDVSLTETVLIQTSPIRMSAHMAVIEAIMALYIKEMLPLERIVQAVKRLTTFSASNELPSNPEEGLILWINKVCVKMKHRIEEDLNANAPHLQMESKDSSKKDQPLSQEIDKSETKLLSSASTRLKEKAEESSEKTSEDESKKNGQYLAHVPPSIPVPQDFSDLTGGSCLATLISFYCPTALRWQDICYNIPASMADTLYNLQLVQKFCRDHLYYNPCYLTLEDLVYQHSSIRQNILAFLADLFFLFEVKPSKVVTSPGLKNEVDATEAFVPVSGRGSLPISPAGKRSCEQAISPIPDLRSNSYSSMPDINRISPRLHSGPQSVKEPMFPRRQIVTHVETRTLERPKRYSFHEAPRSHLNNSGHGRSTSAEETGNSIRRTHSLLDINKSASERGSDIFGKPKDFRKGSPRIEARSHGDADSEPEIYYVHHSRGFTPPSMNKPPDDNQQIADSLNPRILDPLEAALPTSFKYDERDDECHRVSHRYEDEPLLPARLKPAKEKNNSDSKIEERGEYERRLSSHQQIAGGHPRSKSTFRRISSEDSKDGRVHRPSGMEGDIIYSSSSVSSDVPKHSSKNENNSQVQIGDCVSNSEDYFLDKKTIPGVPTLGNENYIPFERYCDNKELEEQLNAQSIGKTLAYVPSVDSDKAKYIIITSEKGFDEHSLHENEKPIMNTTSFAQLSKLRDHHGGGINIVYMQHDRDHDFDGSRHPLKSSFLNKKLGGEKKTTTFATLPNQVTTWQNQGAGSNVVSPGIDSGLQTPTDSNNAETPLSTELHNVRLKLEEKRRRIESDKRKMELVLNRARQKVGKAAFLQAVSKGKGSGRNTPDSGASGDLGSPTTAVEPQIPEESTGHDEKAYTIQEIAENLNLVQNKWFEGQSLADSVSGPDSERPSPDIDGITYEEYTRSLERLTTNLSDIQSDIQRLSHQQNQIQQMMQNGMSSTTSNENAQHNYYTEPPSQQWMPQHHMSKEQDYMSGPHVSLPSTRLSQWGLQMGSGSVSDSQIPITTMGHHRMTAPSSTAYAYIDQHGNIVQKQPDSFTLHPQSGMSVHSQPSVLSEQYAPYGQYTVSPYSGQISYHQTVPQNYPSQSSPAPFRLHTENVSTVPQSQALQSQSQPSQVASTSKLSRPSSIYSSLPSKGVPVHIPPEACMEPQMVHFIENQSPTYEQHPSNSSELLRHFSSLDSLSGTATYRIREPTSPTRPLISKTFRVQKPKKIASPTQELKNQAFDADDDSTSSDTSVHQSHKGADKGFFVSLDDDQPRRSKPPLRVRKVPRGSNRDSVSYQPSVYEQEDRILSHSDEEKSTPTNFVDGMSNLKLNSSEENISPLHRVQTETPAVGFTIKTEESEPDNLDEDEMIKKRERILLNALKRKEEQEMIRAKKEVEFAQRREQERLKQEMIERKREEERARRQAILEQYKQRKALEEQENEKVDPTKTSTLPKTKSKTQRPRPKSLHESAMAQAESRSSNLNLASSGSKGSQLSLAGQGSDTSGSMSFRYGETDSGLGRSTPPRRAPSPGHTSYRHPLSPCSGPPSLPPGLVARRGGPVSDTASDTCSTTSSTLEYTGPKLFKQPTAKSNRGIIINAINSVLAGAVNQETKKRALEEIAQSDSKHFLILFRDSGCQFRALYSYSPEKEEVLKLFGTGPKQVSEQMIDRYYKYNSGGKSFMEIQTKHLTVTIDAFTIHNTLWQGKRGAVPKKEFY